ncbi:hypothetical protein EPK99_06445 [Neorhizobium lilium]|uniref:Uncharacterized protein n=1 Tax=Neorhizobium lilium TaxID=2503024 RepID=A0A3S3TZA5_9HYPH|nr:hypothetical protein [Neorhizobium lilium]RWX78268.1 hypothetical protein EPK99_06445 [Neorhizobium lilium]
MVKVMNLTNSPYDLQGKEGVIRLPAMGEAEGDFQDDYLALLEASMAVRIIDPLDHDHDGKKGGSKAPDESAELTKLRADYHEIVGKKAYHGWDAAELQEKIDAKLAE